MSMEKYIHKKYQQLFYYLFILFSQILFNRITIISRHKKLHNNIFGKFVNLHILGVSVLNLLSAVLTKSYFLINPIFILIFILILIRERNLIIKTFKTRYKI